MKNLKKKSGGVSEGFTLIELLVVMAILAMLSVLAVNGYMGYRKNTLLDLAADNLLAQINEMKSKTIHGAVGSGRIDEIRSELDSVVEDSGAGADEDKAIVKCFGVYFKKNGAEYAANFFDQKFQNKKVWNPVKKWHYQGCEEFGEASYGIGLEMDREIRIVGLSKIRILNGAAGDESALNSLILRFVPIDGRLEMSLDEGKSFVENFDSGEAFKILIQYGAATDLEYQREIIYDLVN